MTSPQEAVAKPESSRILEGRRLAILGAGKMGTSLLQGLIQVDAVERDQVIVTAAHTARLDELKKTLGVEGTLDNRAAVESADVILLCVKPQMAETLLAEIGAALRPDQLLISILASISTMHLEARIAQGVPVVRSMPNTPSLIGAGMSALCAGSQALEKHLVLTERMFAPLGGTARIDERHFDAVTALSASGPAFIYVMLEALADGGVKVGLPRRTAIELAAQAALGASRMVLETGRHPALLKDEVTTPAGCTVDGILQLEEGGVRVALIKTIVEATARARELVDDE